LAADGRQAPDSDRRLERTGLTGEEIARTCRRRRGASAA